MDLDAGPEQQRAEVEQVRSLLDWKRRVLDVYRAARDEAVPERGWRLWREGRDALFRDHPQSPLPPNARASFSGLEYFPYDPSLRVLAVVEPATHERVEIGASPGAPVAFERFGQARGSRSTASPRRSTSIGSTGTAAASFSRSRIRRAGPRRTARGGICSTR